MKNLLQIAACAVAVFTALSSTALAQSSQPYSGIGGLRRCDLLNRINLICPTGCLVICVSSPVCKNISVLA